jgi:hypothetical protein
VLGTLGPHVTKDTAAGVEQEPLEVLEQRVFVFVHESNHFVRHITSVMPANEKQKVQVSIEAILSTVVTNKYRLAQL